MSFTYTLIFSEMEMLLHKKIVHAWFTLIFSGLALFIGGASHSLAAPTTDAVVRSPCGEADFDAALMTVQASASGGTITPLMKVPTVLSLFFW